MSRPLGAQHHSALDVGFTLVQFPDDSSIVAGPSVGWTASAEGRRLFGEINAGGVGTFGAATGSAAVTGGARAPFLPGWQLEGAGELFGIAGSTTHSAGTATASGRVMRAVGRGGAWAGGSASLGHREAGSMPAQALEGGVWWGPPRARLSATVLEQRARGQLYAGPQRQLFIGTIPVHYVEGTVALHLEGNLASLDLTAGARRDPDAETLIEPTFSATAAVWRSPTRALTLSFSRQPPDFVRGADAARWVAIGLRFYEPTPAIVRAARVRPIVQVTGMGETRVVRVRAAGARHVELMADFTDWQPVALTPSTGGFDHAARIGSGSHRILVKIDDGDWRPAANTPAVNDDLGGRVGLLVVP
ncbi:MAG TPA: glycogen-binding domain-containing protein [Gemmatimonadaceae bacterium]|nr:glycogen-binding domain-containing protein [Gemmatimonadaceae bacterium]